MKKGKVYLVGAGPGDVDLITVKGLNAIKEADVLIYDYLATKDLLQYAKEGCQLIYVGKKAGDHTMKQEDICALIAEKASQGHLVTRLKGGDPYVFGRGGEEAIILRNNKIEFEVVPGVTSSIGGLAYAGIPVTHRGISTSFHVMTGHFSKDGTEWDYDALSRLNGTLVFLMGMKNLEKIVQGLMDNGKSGQTPVGIVHWASHKKQRVATGTLETIAEVVRREGLSSPSLIVVGDVVNLRDQLSFFENKPLFGKKVIVTRSRNQASKLSKKVDELGGDQFEFPTISITKPSDYTDIDEKINRLAEYSHIVFSSQNAVVNFMDRVFHLGYDSRHFAETRIAVVGKATERTLRTYGLSADIMPKRYISEALVEPIRSELTPEDKVLITTGQLSIGKLKNLLGPFVMADDLVMYENKIYKPTEDAMEMMTQTNFDYITFSSSSTVDNFVEIMGLEWFSKNPIKIVSIGPITSETLRKHGLNDYFEADEFTIDGVVEQLLKN